MSAFFDNAAGLVILAQDEGPGRSYWFIAVLIVLAIQHFFEKRKEKNATEEMLESNDRIEREWQEDEEEGYHEPEPQNETLLEFFRNVTNEHRPQPVEVPPPPVVPPPPPQQPKSSKPAAKLTAAEQKALEMVKERDRYLNQGHTKRDRMHSSAAHTGLGKMLRDPSSLRNAFILKEVLDPPLAARDDAAPHSI